MDDPRRNVWTVRCSRLATGVGASALIVALVSLHAFQGSAGLPQWQARPGAANAALTLRPSSVELGVLPPDQPARRAVAVQNDRSEEVVLQRVDSTCNCVTVTGLPLCLAPGQTGVIDVSFDPSVDPEFRGALGVVLTGYAGDGRVAFTTEVRVEVRAGLLAPLRRDP
jgi:Protein of unknown function (DUF1573)